MCAQAALFGGLTAALPTLWMARRAFSVPPGATPQELLAGFYRGEVGKYALTGTLFFVGVALFKQHFLALMLTFMAAQAAYWAGPLMLKRN